MGILCMVSDGASANSYRSYKAVICYDFAAKYIGKLSVWGDLTGVGEAICSSRWFSAHLVYM